MKNIDSDNIYTISQLSKLFNITTNKIRFYERKGLLSPIRQENNDYRVYTNSDLLKLQSILLYRSIGLSIDAIKHIINNNEKENYLTHFNNQWEIINNEIHRLSTIRNSLEHVIDNLYEDSNERELTTELLEIIEESNKLNNIKNSWKDKWDFNNWAKTYDRDVKIDRGKLKIYKNYDTILEKVYKASIEVDISKEDTDTQIDNNTYKTTKTRALEDLEILEIGVGTGNLASKYINSNCSAVGIDQSRDMLNVAKQKHPQLKVRLGEFLKIPYENNTFDMIVSTYAFHHLNESEKTIAIKEMMRVLKDNGKIVIGDLMFENKEKEREILSTLTEEQIEEIKDEYYSYIDVLKYEFNKYKKELIFDKIDSLNYIITVK